MDRLETIFGPSGSGKSYSVFKVDRAMKHKAKPESLTRGLYSDIVKDMNKYKAANIDDHTFDAVKYASLQGEWKTEKKEKITMFFKKIWKEINDIKEMIGSLNLTVFETSDSSPNRNLWSLKKRIEELEKSADVEFIDCHTCGCLVRKEIAFRGHDRIEREEEIMFTINGAPSASDPPMFEEVVYKTWYCKLHNRGKKAYGSK